MIIQTTDHKYSVQVKIGGYDDKVARIYLARLGDKTHGVYLTGAEAKRLAYALLLAADGVEP